MVEYKIVKICGLCRERFTVMKADARRRFCDKCEKIVNKGKEVRK